MGGLSLFSIINNGSYNLSRSQLGEAKRICEIRFIR